jgi:hypothetical protein
METPSSTPLHGCQAKVMLTPTAFFRTTSESAAAIPLAACTSHTRLSQVADLTAASSRNSASLVRGLAP